MMDDHAVLSRARNDLADALKALLRAEIMTAKDFQLALLHATAACAALKDLLGEQ